MCPIFVIKISGVSNLQGDKVPDFPLTLLVIVTTVLRYCDTDFWTVVAGGRDAKVLIDPRVKSKFIAPMCGNHKPLPLAVDRCITLQRRHLPNAS